MLISKVKLVYEVNYKTQRIEKIPLSKGDIITKAKEIDEYEFYYYVIQVLIEKNGQDYFK